MTTIRRTLLGMALAAIGAAAMSVSAPTAQADMVNPNSCTGGPQLCQTQKICVGELIQVCETNYYYQKQS